jgi:hypothetical protein
VTDGPDLTTFRARLEAKRAREAAAASVSEDIFDSDLVPDLSDTSTPRTENPELDAILDRISILDAYRKWCGKSKPSNANKRKEGIKVSCPKPDHPDRDPSAWLNTEKNVWFCGSCEEGGDAYDIAAYHFGYPVTGYKEGATFHTLRQKMAESYGYTFVSAPGATEPLIIPPEPEPVEVDEPEETGATVTHLHLVEDDGSLPRLDWEKLVESGTFLDEYMNVCIKGDVPEEYHFWNAMLAIGLAVGRDVTLSDYRPVLGNLFICLLGPTGDGKSRSYHTIQELIHRALPHKWEDPNSKGALFISSPGSAEFLIDQFMKPVADPVDPKRVAYYAPVRGLIEFNELSLLVGKVARKGSVLKPTLMDFYDGSTVISSGSMGTGKKKAENAFASCFTTTQPLALRELLRDTDAHSGFLNRWIFATATPKRRVAVGGHRIDISTAIDPLQKIVGWAGMGRELGWSDEGLRLFTEFFHDVLHPAQQADETGLLTRMDLLAKKLCLLFSVNGHHPEVTGETVNRVISMFGYLTAAYGVPAAHFENTSTSRDVLEELEKHIKRYTDKKGGISLNELRKCIKRKNYPIELVSKTLKNMADLGYIESFRTTGVGRPTLKYRALG